MPDYAGTIPQQTFMIYQLMFAIITPALITGAFAERMKFSGTVLFMTLWFFLVYAPTGAHGLGQRRIFERGWEAGFLALILRAGRSCTFLRAYRRWSARCTWANVSAFRSKPCRRTAWC